MAAEAEGRTASRTALGVLAMRAAHRILDAEPWLLDDPVALRLLEPGAEARIRSDERLQAPLARALRAHVLLRSRLAEEALQEAAAAGLRQAVLLGAGFDTFAYRQPAWATGLKLFEVDHPASQAEKRRRVEAAGLAAPPNLIHAPVDFESVSLAEGLSRAGFSTGAPAFLSWLGVTMYLTRPAIRAVLAFIGGLPAGTCLALTFAQPTEDGGDDRLAGLAAEAGEPWISRFTPAELAEELRAAGFRRWEIPSPEALAQRFFVNRADGLPAPRRATLAFAEV
ncbi:MAG TPA: class I SAM-dependent methyltransferase [Holophagaceae bacterium]|nr:class I SAM-dependent methyltransferase [Holophagaceae bacterium]